ncbi:MAG: hypothetical protein ACO2OO_01950 [Candidatus Aenigmatarchaeota archaeon]
MENAKIDKIFEIASEMFAELTATPISKDIEKDIEALLIKETPTEAKIVSWNGNVIAQGTIDEVIEIAQQKGYAVPRGAVRTAKPGSKIPITLTGGRLASLGGYKLPVSTPPMRISDADNLAATILVGAARSLGQDVIIEPFAQSIRLSQFSAKMEFFNPDIGGNIIGRIQSGSITGFVLGYEIRVDVTETTIPYTRDDSGNYNAQPSTGIAYELLRQAFNHGEAAPRKSRTTIERISLANYTEISSDVAAVAVERNNATPDEVQKFVVYKRGAGIRWNYYTLHLNTNIPMYKKLYYFIPGDPVVLELNFNESFLNDELYTGNANLELIRSLKGYITCIMKILKVVSR